MCCHPVDGQHYNDEPDTCCHSHAEDLPANHRTEQGEPWEPPPGWTAQGEAQYLAQPTPLETPVDYAYEDHFCVTCGNEVSSINMDNHECPALVGRGEKQP